MSVHVGIDVHRKRSQVAMVAEDGTVQLNKNVVNGSTPFLRLIGDLPSGTPVAFEAAFGWSWLADLLEDYGFEAHLVHPLRCKAIASARLKNDKVDAARRSTRSASSPTSPGQDGRSPDGRSSWPGCTGKPSWSASPAIRPSITGTLPPSRRNRWRASC
jgi:Transposase